MKTCQNCGCEVIDDARFCKNCGSEIIEEVDVSSSNVCPSCGHDVEDGMKFCRNCGFKLDSEESNGAKTQFCSNCGSQIDAGLNFCPDCGRSTGSQVASLNAQVMSNTKKSPILAAILSFLIIGLGQVYLGLTKKGIILFVLAIISGILTLIFIGAILWLLVWIYAIYDGVNSANKINEGIPVEDTLDLHNLF